jgi:hypothetical protein
MVVSAAMLAGSGHYGKALAAAGIAWLTRVQLGRFTVLACLVLTAGCHAGETIPLMVVAFYCALFGNGFIRKARTGRTPRWLGRAALIAYMHGCIGCVQPQGFCGDHGRPFTAAEWAPVAKLMGIEGKECHARVMVVDDAQAELYGLGERDGAERWYSGHTESCGGATLSMIRVDGEAMHPGLIAHEALHAAIDCATDGETGDPDHTLDVWNHIQLKD